jgi:hypothetical protein
VFYARLKPKNDPHRLRIGIEINKVPAVFFGNLSRRGTKRFLVSLEPFANGALALVTEGRAA